MVAGFVVAVIVSAGVAIATVNLIREVFEEWNDG